jgi:2-dehydropantoate 2-reductase
VDPGGVIARAIALERVIGCVVHASASTVGPGIVHHLRGQGLIIGEPSGVVSERVQRVATLLERAGFDTTLSTEVRKDIWYKLWGNLTTNPVSAVTGATTDRIIADPLVSAFCIAAMAEAKAVGERIGCALAQEPVERHEITRKLGVFKTSMLQDAEAGRALELDAIVGAVRELGQRVGVPTPQIDTLFGLTRLFGRVHGIYPGA